MRKFIVALAVLALSLSFASAQTNANKIILDKWKDMATVTITGVAPVPLVLKTEVIESITITADGFLTIIGKVDTAGNQMDVFQVGFFSWQVMIKSKTDAKTNTTKRDMIILTGAPTKLF